MQSFVLRGIVKLCMDILLAKCLVLRLQLNQQRLHFEHGLNMLRFALSHSIGPITVLALRMDHIAFLATHLLQDRLGTVVKKMREYFGDKCPKTFRRKSMIYDGWRVFEVGGAIYYFPVNIFCLRVSSINQSVTNAQRR